MSDEQLQRAIDRATAEGKRNGGWPPNLPEFVAHALGDYEDFGLMDEDEAFYAATRGEYWHRGIFHAISRAGGTWAFRRLETDVARKKFIKGYRHALDVLREGRLIIPPPVAPADARLLGQPEIKQRDIEKGIKAMAHIKAMLHRSPPVEEPPERDDDDLEVQDTQD